MKRLRLNLVLAFLLFAFTVNAQDIILTEGFNTGSIPTGWTESWETGTYEAHWGAGHIGGTNDFPAYPNSGNYNLQANKSTSATTSTCRITTPSMDLSSYQHVAFEFYAVSGQSAIFMDDFDVYYKTSASGIWQPLLQEWFAAPSWSKFTFQIPDDALTNDFYISWVANVTMAWITLDDVKVYEYFEAPTNLVAVSNTNNVDLSWTEVSMSGFSNYKIYRNGTELATTSSSTYTDNSVTQNTAYDYYVTAIYGTNESEKTNLAPAAPDGMLVPYSQDFENEGNIPTAWSNTWKTPYANNSAETFDFPFYFNGGGLGDEGGAPEPSSAYEGSYCATVKLQETMISLETMLISPMFNLSETASSLTFQLYNGDKGSFVDKLKIFYKNTLNGDWRELAHITEVYNSWTLLSYALPNPSATYWVGFEAKTKSGYGVTIDNVEIRENLAGTVVDGANICGVSSTPLLTLQGFTGTVIKWQKRLDAGLWTDITNTNDTYQETVSSQGTWDYRAVVENNGSTFYSGYTTVFTVEPSAGGEVANTMACLETGNGVTLDFSYNQEPVGGVLVWQIADEGQSNWSDIEGSTGYPYQYYPDFFGTYDVRAKVQSGTVCDIVYSETGKLELANNDAELTGPSLVCAGSTADIEIFPISAPIFYIYEWEKSTAPFTTWLDLNNTGNATLTTEAITEETHYRVRCRSFPCEIRYIELTIEGSSNISGGNIIGTAALCTGSTTDLTLIDNAGDIQEWQYLEAPYSGDWTTIANTEANYTTNALTISTKFRTIVTQETCDPAYSEELEVVVSENTVAGQLTAVNTEICLNSLTGDITLSDNIGNVNKWQKRLNSGNWINIFSTEIIYSEMPTEIGVWDYRAEIQNGGCDAIFTTEVTITVNDGGVATGTLAGGTPEICLDNETGTMTISGYDGTVSKWQKNLNAGDWQNIANENDTHSEIPDFYGNWNYRVEINNNECGMIYSNEIQITVNANAIAAFDYVVDEQQTTFTNNSTFADSYTWDFGDGNSSTEENPVYSYTNAGNYTVELTATNNNCGDDIHTENFDIAVGINEIETEISIFPNPTNGIFVIKNKHGFINFAKFQVISITGKIVYTSKLQNFTDLEIDLTNQPQGIYIIKIQTENGTYTEKLIIQ